MKKEEIPELLRSCELFNELDKKEISKIAKHCIIRSYKKGENVFCQGDRCGDLSIIASGSVFLERSVNMGKRKGRATICILGKGREGLRVLVNASGTAP